MTDHPMLRDSDGDLWEVLPESGYVPKQDENWIRYQDDGMRERAIVLTAENTSRGSNPTVAGEQAWDEIYSQSGHPRVYIREVPHELSTGASPQAGPRGVYEVMAWLGAGLEGRTQPGALYRALVRPSTRWYHEMLTAAQIDLAAIDRDDPAMLQTVEALEAAVEYNSRAYAIASRSERELSVTEMQEAIAAEE